MRENWTYKKLGEVCNILNGFAFKSGNYTGQGIRVMRITNVQKGLIVDDDPKYYPLDEEQNIEQYMLKEDDLLMSLTGNVGRVGLLQKELLPAALNQRVACIRITFNDILLKYVFHFLNSDSFERDCIFNATGIAQKNMSTEWLKKYIIPVPSLSEQQSIVAELDKINELISLKKAQLSDLDNLAQSIFYDMFGDPIENKKGWEVKKLGELCEIVRGGSPRPINNYLGGDIPWIKIGDATTGDDIYLHSTKEYIIKEGLKKTRYIPTGSLIFANCGVSLGFARIITFKGCIHDGWLAMMNIKEEKLGKIFLLKSLNFCTQYFRNNAPEGTQPNLNTNIMKVFKQILPPLSLQQDFAKRIELIEQQKAQISSTIKDLETLLASRMQYWFD